MQTKVYVEVFQIQNIDTNMSYTMIQKISKGPVILLLLQVNN